MWSLRDTVCKVNVYYSLRRMYVLVQEILSCAMFLRSIIIGNDALLGTVRRGYESKHRKSPARTSTNGDEFCGRILGYVVKFRVTRVRIKISVSVCTI